MTDLGAERRSVAPGAYTSVMPTTRPRHPVTETDEVAAILDAAARRWGDLPRSKLIRLILDDWAHGGRSGPARAAARASLVGSVPGSSGAYDRAEDWPV